MQKENDSHNPDVLTEKNSLIFVVTRTSILGLAILWASYYTTVVEPDIESTQLFIPLALFLALSVISGIWLANYKPGPIFTQIELTIYAILVSAIIYLSGLAGSPLLFMYLPLSMVAAIVTSRNNALFVSLISLLCYYALIQNHINSWLILPEIAEVIDNPPQGLNFQILSMASGMALVSIATGYLKEKLKIQTMAAVQAQTKLDSLVAEEQDILDELSSGVILFDKDGALIKYNNCMLEILGLAGKTSQQISDFVLNLFSDIKEIFKGAEVPSVESKIVLRTGDSISQTISYKFKWINRNNEKRLVLLVQDVTKFNNVENELALQNEMARLLAKPKITQSEGAMFPGFIGESPKIKSVFKTISKVAPAETTVLINGESGTGKELVARAVHSLSSRAMGPFVAVNCGAIPENLIESQLFGHKRGSFTGAVGDQKGYFQQANGGTLFLDEIGELPINLQAKLLRTIQEKTIRPIGSENDLSIDVRIVSATNRDLAKEVSVGKFREDLYYRLNVISINLPSLRERKEDILLLVKNILNRLVKDGSQPVIPPDSIKLLMAYNYPGNIRELENIIERAFVLGGEIILPEHLPECIRGNHIELENKEEGSKETLLIENASLVSLNENFDLDTYLAEIERKFLETALVESDGVKTRAAEKLGMNFRSFRYRLRKFGIADEDSAEIETA